MRSITKLGFFALAVIALGGGYVCRADDDSRQVIIAAMRRVFSGTEPPLILRAAAGDASETEKQRLVKVLGGMAQAQPDHGSADSWKAKTVALTAAAQDLLDGKAGAGERLRAAADCRACHQAHRGRGDQ